MENVNLEELFSEDYKTTAQEVTPPQKTPPQMNKQKKFLVDLIKQKNSPIKIEDVVTMSYQEADMAIKKLLETKKIFSISSAQEVKILQLCEELNLPVPDTSRLEGGKEGTGSKTIQKLLKLKEINSLKTGVTEKQEKHIKKMMVCPDLEVFEGKTKKDAEKWIKTNTMKYDGWLTTRATPAKRKFINTLRLRVGDPELQECELIQFSDTLATKYINQLKKELYKKDEVINRYKEKHVSDQECRSILNSSEISKKQHEDLIQCIYALYKSIGQEAEDDLLHASDKLIKVSKDFGNGVISHYQTEIKTKLENLIQFVSIFNGSENIKAICEKIFTSEEIDQILAI